MTRKQQRLMAAIKARAVTRRHVTAKDLSRDLGWSMGAVTQMLARLYAKGHIRRTIEVLE